MLGELTEVRISTATLRRLRTIKTMFELLTVEPISHLGMASEVNLSPSGVRKNMRILNDADVVYRTNPCAPNVDGLYLAIEYDEVREEFIRQLDDFIASRVAISCNSMAPIRRRRPTESSNSRAAT
jgi:predicted transcriptional regulator